MPPPLGERADGAPLAQASERSNSTRGCDWEGRKKSGPALLRKLERRKDTCKCMMT
eukprot:CAMPEP_0204563170 /NCGR_PEP_ID=MMETSP0661-20131031/34160_1 /ASSEMBLY_ACC=CAM_ASM_000606 /TAXON_ID=109239 /ORGANISM="Alexandrium margalefi, Strain AMGDE01CS-322" /LENGTH=55 /DNA_ID=CAMNT_0051570707 /DNA_START=160 /DNA_END=323 /DNA_ORIENTATION=-